MNEGIREFFSFVSNESDKLLEQTLVHSGLTFLSLFLALAISLPLGIWITRHERWSKLVLGFAGVLQTIPSIALLGFMIPILGIGPKPAIVALFMYALLPIIRNVYTGIKEVNPSIKEAAVAMGMTQMQVLRKVELPLAFPVIMAGIRTATVINVGVATLAAYIGAGGLGEFIFGGIALNNSAMILAGAIPAALLALLFDFLLSRVQHLRIKNFKRIISFLAVAFFIISSLYFVPTTFGSKLTAGFPPEFMGRSDGYDGLKKIYHLKINTVVIGPALVYKAIKQKQVDVISGYSTDGRVKAYQLQMLKDDRHLFPPYYAAPLVRKDIIVKYPQLRDAINLLAGKINDSIMTELNYQVDILHQSPEKVAKDFLKRIQLFRMPSGARDGKIKIGSKIFSEQYTLVAIYKYLIEGYTDLSVETSTGLGGTKICFESLMNDQIDFYPEYTGTGLQVLLNPPQSTVDSVMTSAEKTYQFVKEEFERKFNLEWLTPIGFNNTYTLLMRTEESDQLKIHSISDLVSYLQKRK